MIFTKKNNNIIKVKLILPACNVVMGPPVSTILGQYRVDMQQFCKVFNESTKGFEKGVLLPVKILLKPGSLVSNVISTPSVMYLVKRLVVEILKEKYKRLTYLMFYKILIIKLQNNKLTDLAVLRSLLGTIKSMQLNKYHLFNNS